MVLAAGNVFHAWDSLSTSTFFRGLISSLLQQSSRLHRPENFIIIVSDSTTTTQYDTAITDELPLGLGRGRAVATPRRDRHTHNRAGSNPVGDFFDAVEAGTGLSTHSIVVVARRCLDRVARGRTLKGTTGGR